MSDLPLQKTIFLRASPEEVWSYLTDPDKLAIWFHRPKKPLTEGEAYAMFGTETGDKLMWGHVKTARPHDLLEYSFTIAPMGEAVSHVRWDLQPVAGGTRLSLQHSALPGGVEAFGLTLALDQGWDDHLARLRADLHG